MLILSMDLGKFKTVCCFYETTTREYRFTTIKTKRDEVEKLFVSEKVGLVVMEACGPSGWISDICHEKQLKTIVCSTNDEAWAWKNTKRKTDRDDALKLAKMAMMGLLTSVHVPNPEVREQRTLIKYRKTLDQRINRIKNAIRSLFANHGIEIDTGKRAWCTCLPTGRLDAFASTAFVNRSRIANPTNCGKLNSICAEGWGQTWFSVFRMIPESPKTGDHHRCQGPP